jgi:hypothetical protein
MEKSKKSEFVFTLEGIELPEDVHSNIARDIQDVVMKHLGGINQRQAPSRELNKKAYLMVNQGRWNGGILRAINPEKLKSAIDKGNIKEVGALIGME